MPIQKHPDHDTAAIILSQLTEQNRSMSQLEYTRVKQLEWYYQQQFWNAHITEEGFAEYRSMASQGKYGKFPGYLKIWEKYNSPLMRALR